MPAWAMTVEKHGSSPRPLPMDTGAVWNILAQTGWLPAAPAGWMFPGTAVCIGSSFLTRAFMSAGKPRKAKLSFWLAPRVPWVNLSGKSIHNGLNQFQVCGSIIPWRINFICLVLVKIYNSALWNGQALFGVPAYLLAYAARFLPATQNPIRRPGMDSNKVFNHMLIFTTCE